MSQNPHHSPESEWQTEEAPAPQAETDPSPVPSQKKKLPKRFLFFASCAVIAILVYSIANAGNIATVFKRLGSILAPLTIGGIIAYLCNPIMRFYEYVVFRKVKKGNFHRIICLIMTVLTVFAILAGVLALIIPELVSSIRHLIEPENLKSYADSLLASINSIVNKITANTSIEIDISTTENFVHFIQNTFGDMAALLDKVADSLSGFMQGNTIGNVWNFLVSVFTALKNLLIGLFIAFYILASKEKRSAQVRKARAALLNETQDRKLTEITLLVNQTFGGFVKGILLDALIVGVLTYIFTSIFQISEYNLLIAAICAITNVIPVFGPFIGAIPSGLIVLISNPSKLLAFLIIILVIQQIDGNIIAPRIQGSNTNISSLAVLIAITVMGSLFGIMGMIIGVPIFAVVIELFKRWLESRLERRGYPTDTVAYYPEDTVGNAEEDVYYEHSHWRYKYEHSKFKARLDRRRAARIDKRQKRTDDRRSAQMQKDRKRAEKADQKKQKKQKKTSSEKK